MVSLPTRQAVLTRTEAVSARPALRTGERIAIAYFLYAAFMLSVHSAPFARVGLAWMVPVVVTSLIFIDNRYSRKWSGVARDWSLLALILVAYWQVDWFPASTQVAWQHDWVRWDRILLHDWELQAAIEGLGWLIPSSLEAAYLSLYTLPPLGLAAIYVRRRRARADRYLSTLVLGAFCAYALLPHFPSQSPRVAFPGSDAPNFGGLWRSINLWLLDHLDISTSVFPSGHVAVAFSSTFGLARALPQERWLWLGFLSIAVAVYTATVYCRYHYAVDGLASIVIALLAWRGSIALERYA